MFYFDSHLKYYILKNDIYRKSRRPQSTDRELMQVSRKAIIGLGIGVGILVSILLQMGVSLQYVYLTMGIWIGSGVTPIFAIRDMEEDEQNWCHCLVSWGTSKWHHYLVSVSFILYGELSVMSIGRNIPQLLGTLLLSRLAPY
jgi:Na+/proline symporter